MTDSESQQAMLDDFGADTPSDPVHKDSNGYVWMVNLPDATNLPEIVRQTAGSWFDPDNAQVRPGTVDDIWMPLVAEDIEQLEARRDLLREGSIGSKHPLRIKSRRSLP